MAEFYIQIRDGQPFEHPISHKNFVLAFPEIDTDNLPPEYAVFVRHAPPTVGQYEVLTEQYVWDGSVVADSWTATPMNDDERAEVDKGRRDDIYSLLETQKKRAEERIANLTNEANRERWISYLAKLNAWVLEDLDNPNFPEIDPA